MRRALILVPLAAALAAGCGGSGERAVAHVGKSAVTREQLEQTVEHFREEAKREGKAFPDDPTAEKHLLGLLVYRARLQAGAAALGITISRDDVERRLETSGGDSGEKDARAFLESSARAQLLTEAVYRKLAARIHDTDPERRQTRRNAALQHWLASLTTRYPAR